VSNLSREQLDELREDFSYNDRDHDGRISFEEFEALLADLESGVGPVAARIGFADIDEDGDGAIEFSEFIKWWATD
jgi:Ca2+-binding EF-hand superfamily protein